MDREYKKGDQVRVIVCGRYGMRKATVTAVDTYCVDVKIDYNGAFVPFDRCEIELIATVAKQEEA